MHIVHNIVQQKVKLHNYGNVFGKKEARMKHHLGNFLLLRQPPPVIENAFQLLKDFLCLENVKRIISPSNLFLPPLYGFSQHFHSLWFVVQMDPEE